MQANEFVINAVPFEYEKHNKLFDVMNDPVQAKAIRLLCETKQATVYECNNGSHIFVRVMTDITGEQWVIIMYVCGENPLPYIELVKEKCREKGIRKMEFESAHKGMEKYAEKAGFKFARSIYEITL